MTWDPLTCLDYFPAVERFLFPEILIVDVGAVDSVQRVFVEVELSAPWVQGAVTVPAHERFPYTDTQREGELESGSCSNR